MVFSITRVVLYTIAFWIGTFKALGLFFLFYQQVSIPCMTRNRIIVLSSWSALEEIVRYLHTYEESEKVKIIHQQMQVSGVSRGNRKFYTPEFLFRAFSYYAVSRSLYERLKKDYQLPSVSTLARITSSPTKSSSSEFLKTVFEGTENERKPCVPLHDEVYIKKSLQYHGGEIFGKAVNDPSILAETMLGQMINCLHGGKNFLVSMLHVAKNNERKFLAQRTY